MSSDVVERFLAALDPAHREAVGGQPRAEQERLAAAWEKELAQDTDLDTLDELSPPPRNTRPPAGSWSGSRSGARPGRPAV